MSEWVQVNGQVFNLSKVIHFWNYGGTVYAVFATPCNPESEDAFDPYQLRLRDCANQQAGFDFILDLIGGDYDIRAADTKTGIAAEKKQPEI